MRRRWRRTGCKTEDECPERTARASAADEDDIFGDVGIASGDEDDDYGVVLHAESDDEDAEWEMMTGHEGMRAREVGLAQRTDMHVRVRRGSVLASPFPDKPEAQTLRATYPASPFPPSAPPLSSCHTPLLRTPLSSCLTPLLRIDLI